jgi:RND family efflux transporter MFP subunit
MKTIAARSLRLATFFSLLLAFAVGGFLAGSLRTRHGSAASSAEMGRKILYYVDPMNPAHTSDRPGLAPCGMKMEPVYADAAQQPAANEPENLAAGAVRLSAERQQLAGIRVSRVEKRTLPSNLHFSGSVAVDEARVYRIHAAVNGWISRALPFSTGSLVRKDEVLAELNSPEVLPAVQSLLLALNTRGQPVEGEGVESPVLSRKSLSRVDLTYEQGLAGLRHLGMGQPQLDELLRSRKLVKTIAVTAPADGLLIARAVSDELHVEKGHELFRVADLSRVWVLADIPGWEGDYLVPGTRARVSVPGQTRTFTATVAKDLPLFDNNSRTLKVRLEVDNPDYALRPDMFVNLELSVDLPEMLLVNSDAVLDSGRSQTVFLDRGDGYFEPKHVKTGRRVGDQIEIIEGLAPGERIVTSGNFLLDSESRMKKAAAANLEVTTIDPVCGMSVDAQEVRSTGQVSAHQGKTWYFCSQVCKRAFDADPAKFMNTPAQRPIQTAETGRTRLNFRH